MKYLIKFVGLSWVIGLLGVCQNTSAGMIGDVLTIERLYPNLVTQFQPSASTQVQTGITDEVFPFGFERINPEDESISIHWIRNSQYIGSDDVFDGYRFSGFSDVITNVSVSSINNLSSVMLDFGSNFITLNFGSSFDSSSYLELSVEFVPVPEPSTLPLFCTAALLMFWAARRNRC